MAIFKDCMGQEWILDFKTDSVMRVRNLIMDDKGNPIDLLDMADTGNLHQLYGNSRRMIDVVFLCVLDQVKEQFDEKLFNETFALDMEIFPEIKENVFKKMAYWFGGRLDGSAIESMTKAFKEALTNFTPNPYQREALLVVLERQDKIMESQANRLATQTEVRYQEAEKALEANSQKKLEQIPQEIQMFIEKENARLEIP